MRAVPVPQGYLFSLFFSFSFFYITSIYRYYLDNFYVSYTLVSRNRVSLESSRFSMMAEIVCMVYVEENRFEEGKFRAVSRYHRGSLE